MKKWISCALTLLSVFGLFAQDFQYEANLNKVEQEGYYTITLAPDLLGLTTRNQSDLRLMDDAGNEQPYIKDQEAFASLTSLFVKYTILEKMYEKDTVSYLIFHNPEKRKINNVSFVVKNTAVQKRARLSGSDDRGNWYVIKNDYLLHSMESHQNTTELRMLNFPLSDYTYFKLEINDNRTLPINIVEVGFYDTQKSKGISTTFNCPIVSQMDSAKHTYVKLVLPDTVYAEKLKLDLSGSEFYSRNAKVLVKNEYFTRKKKRVFNFTVIGSGNLNSNSSNEIDLGGVTVKELYLEIENKDNPPLNVDGVTGSLLNKYIIAELQPNKSYHLSFGNNKLKAPEYDLVKFRDKIKVQPTKVKHQEVRNLKKKTLETNETPVFDNVYFVWLIIGIVGIGLAIISFKMLKEIGNRG